MNTGGWLLLSVLFGALLLLVQRSERNRRFATIIILGIVGVVIWRYALYKMGDACAPGYQLVCASAIAASIPVRPHAPTVAIATINAAIGTAIVFNIFFFLLIGRYNPPGSSDNIVVLGMND
ncbi:MAG TPA: hypothetical protein VMT34_08260 [Aggregatilineales bacterium]|nr:hypothetical protein [Aggregatilineales bacterium]